MFRSEPVRTLSKRYVKFMFLFCVPSGRPYVPSERVATYALFNYLYFVILLGLGFEGIYVIFY
jgi:hypothetical protein